MRKLSTLAIALSTAASIGVMPTAAAQTTSVEDAGIPYAITFNGSLYPANLETIEYPFIAASQERDGECLVKIISDEAGSIASMSVASCSDDAFESAAARYISQQRFEASTSSNLMSHNLRINWDIGMELKPAPLQIAAR